MSIRPEKIPPILRMGALNNGKAESHYHQSHDHQENHFGRFKGRKEVPYLRETRVI